MAISNFKLPVGLDVSGSTTFSGSINLSAGSKIVGFASDVSASAVSASVGRFGDLNVASLTAPSLNLAGDLTVNGNTTLGDSSADLVFVSGTLTASAGAKVLNGLEVNTGDLNVTAGNISGSAQLNIGGAATIAGGLDVSGADLDASTVAVSASLLTASSNAWVGGTLSVGTDLVVAGDLTVNGTTTYINTTNLLVEDDKVVIASGSATANLAGIYLGNEATPVASLYYTNGDTSWNTDKTLKVQGDVSASVKVTAPTGDFTVLTGSTTTGSIGRFGELTASIISTQVVFADSVAARTYGGSLTNVLTMSVGETGSLPLIPVVSASAARYVITARNASNEVHTIEALVTHDKVNSYFTSYASLYSVSPLINITSSCAGGVVATGVENISAGHVSASYIALYTPTLNY